MSNRTSYRIKLKDEERETFDKIASGKPGKLNIAAWKVQPANAMFKCDESDKGPAWHDQQIAEACGVTTRSLENWWKQTFEQEPLSLLERKERETPPTSPILDGEQEARTHEDRLFAAAGRTLPMDLAIVGRPSCRASGGRIDFRRHGRSRPKKRVEAVATVDVVNHVGLRHPQYALCGVARCRILARRGVSHSPQTQNRPHANVWQLAEHGRVGTECDDPAVLCRPRCQPRRGRQANPQMVHLPKRPPDRN